MNSSGLFIYLMFSYFKNGVKNTDDFRNISINQLVKLIRTFNPLIQVIRDLDVKDKNYKNKKTKLKGTLSYVTPNCTVTYRSDKHINNFSGYIYFDIDDVSESQDEVIAYKNQLIERYKESIALICLSSSGYGLSILVKVDNEITGENFDSIRNYIGREIFTDLKLDPNTKDKSRPWYIPYDPDCYHNPASFIEVPENVISNQKSANDNINKDSNGPTQKSGVQKKYKYNFIGINEVLNKLKFKTEVPVDNRIYDVKYVEFCEVYVRKSYRIPDGKKHVVFSICIRNLFHLNPSVEPDYIFSYIYWLNEYRTVAGTKMVLSQLIHLFGSIHKEILETGLTKHTFKIKRIHFKKNTISTNQKKAIVGLYRRINSNEIVQLTRQIIEENRKGAIDNINNPLSELLSIAPLKKVTQKDVFDYLKERSETTGSKGLSMRTIKEYWKYDTIDIKEVELRDNLDTPITYIAQTDKTVELKAHADDHTSVLDTQIQDQTIKVADYKPETGMLSE